MKGTIQEDITIVNIYAPNIRAPQYIQQIQRAIKGEINSNSITVGNFNAPLSLMDRSPRQKINKETWALNDMSDLTNLIDIYRACHLKAAEYTCFWSAHSPGLITFWATKWALVNLRKLKSIKHRFQPQCYEIRNIQPQCYVVLKKKKLKNTNMWRLNNILLNNQWITEETTEEIKKKKT